MENFRARAATFGGFETRSCFCSICGEKSAFHFVQNRDDHVEGWTFSWILVHTNSYQLRQMRRYAAWDTHSEIFQSNLRSEINRGRSIIVTFDFAKCRKYSEIDGKIQKLQTNEFEKNISPINISLVTKIRFTYFHSTLHG